MRKSTTTSCWSRCGFASRLIGAASFRFWAAACWLRRLVCPRLLSWQRSWGVVAVAADFSAERRLALSARFHFADDGTIRCVLRKGRRAARERECELAQAAAEELRVPLRQIRMIARRHGRLARTMARLPAAARRREPCRPCGRRQRRFANCSSSRRRRNGRSSRTTVEVRDGTIAHAASKRSADLCRGGEG